MRKLVAALACRNQGSRLYGKPLQNLDFQEGIMVIDNIISCLSSIECIDSIVLGISEGNDNLSFIDYAEKKKLKYIIGDEEDVLSRLVQCGEKVGGTDIFRTTSESPYPYYEMIESNWEAHCENDNDATFLDDVIDGCGFEIITMAALKKSHTDGQKKHRSEHCSLFIRENKSDFKIGYPEPPAELIRKDLRFTVDYPEDLIVCRAVYNEFKEHAPFIPLKQAVQYLDENKHFIDLISPFCEIGYSTMYR